MAGRCGRCGGWRGRGHAAKVAADSGKRRAAAAAAVRETIVLRGMRAARLGVCLLIALLPAAIPAAAPARAQAAPAAVAPGGVISSIRVVGNQRIEASTIRSYLLVTPGQPFDPNELNRSLKVLYSTGLFRNVAFSRQGDVLVVRVVENPIVNQVAFEGNHALTAKELSAEIQLRPRAVYTAATARADRRRILNLYGQKGHFNATVTPEIIKLSQNRVNVVFRIHDGPASFVSRIAFVGNHAFGEGTLRTVINTRQEAWWRFLTSSDTYSPDRVKFDEELLRRFYLRHGFLDFRVVSANAELSPTRRAFFLTFTLHEGPRWKVAKVTVDSLIPKLAARQFRGDLALGAGDWYDGDAVRRTIRRISDAAQQKGFPFAEVKPDIRRNPKTHTIALTFNIVQGPRVYIQRIEITGNTRTEDQVIRREFHLAEGDPLIARSIRNTDKRLHDLNYFKSVAITASPGTTPDKVIVHAKVVEKPTGQLTIGGGYSTDIGFLTNLGISQDNFLGTGRRVAINGLLAQRATQINLSITDPHFLGRNLLAGVNIFDTINNNQINSSYDEQRIGTDFTLGYSFNNHVRQSWTYSAVDRNVYNIVTGASLYVLDEAGWSFLSQLGTTFTFDYRDSAIDPHRGFVVRVGGDVAGLGGSAYYVRGNLSGTYYIPLDAITGNSDWGIAIGASAGYLTDYNGYHDRIIDRFFLGGANLLGFADGGAGPHDINSGDSLGGRFIWTQTTTLRFPLPISPDLGISGRAFVDVGSLTGVSAKFGPVYDNASPRVGAGIGFSWKTPFGLLDLDFADAVVKYKYDKTQVFRFGFGTRF